MRRSLAENTNIIQWAKAEFSALRPGNAGFLIEAARAGVKLARALEQARILQEWVRHVADCFQEVRPPPRIEETLTFPMAGASDGFFWSQKWWDDACDMLDRIKQVTGTAGALDGAIAAWRAEFNVLETPWVTMAANANLTLNMKTKLEGARTKPLGRREIALLEIICDLRHEKPSGDHLNYLSARKKIVEQATKLLRITPVGAITFTDLRARRRTKKA